MPPRKWDVSKLAALVKESRSIRELLGKLGLRAAGGNYSQIKKYLKLYNIDATHFTGRGWNVHGRSFVRTKAPINELLVEGSDYQSFKLKRRLIKEGIREEKCEKCGWHKHAEDGRVPLELHHVNGNRKDNRLINLQILCPNCHSLEPNHRGKNIKPH